MELKEILLAREERAHRQKELLAQYRKPLLCYTMNIPGPEKNSPLITKGFLLGKQWIDAQFPHILHYEQRLLPTGCEAYYVLDGEEDAIKELSMEVEQSHPMGRLLDLDVLTPAGEKLSRSQPRKCLLCDGDARLCARSRRHSLKDLEKQVTQLLTVGLREAKAQQIATHAVRSLLYELCTTPKPGLVDLNNNGCHRDMDPFTFCNSATSLMPHFTRIALLAIETATEKAEEVFPKLRYQGRLAENAMFRATKGVNTHKGAIFSLGLLCAAAGRLEAPYDSGKLCAEVATLCKGLVDRELVPLTHAQTKGEAVYLRQGASGIRGQAEKGFPAVREIGLPILEEGLARGYDLHRSGTAALLAMLCKTDDTCVLSHCSPKEYRKLQEETQALLTRQAYPERETLEALDREFIRKGYSPGGCADLLTLCHFLHSICEYSDPATP